MHMDYFFQIMRYSGTYVTNKVAGNIEATEWTVHSDVELNNSNVLCSPKDFVKTSTEYHFHRLPRSRLSLSQSRRSFLVHGLIPNTT